MSSTKTDMLVGRPALFTWLDMLGVMLPPTGVLLVGAGAGTGTWVRYLQEREISNVMLVEGGDQLFKQLKETVSPRHGWNFDRQVVAQSAGTVDWYEASNLAESGLLEPESLRAFWPNLDTRKKTARPAITLHELLQSDPSPNWLMLDCLPAASLLRGGAQYLNGVDVALVRVVSGSEVSATGAHVEEVDALLQVAGLRRIHSLSERHPALAHALYARDARHHVREQEQQLVQSEIAVAEAKKRVAVMEAAMAEAKESSKKRDLEQQAQLEQVSKARAEADTKLLRQQAEVKQLQERAAVLEKTNQQLTQELDKLRAQVELLAIVTSVK